MLCLARGSPADRPPPSRTQSGDGLWPKRGNGPKSASRRGGGGGGGTTYCATTCSLDPSLDVASEVAGKKASPASLRVGTVRGPFDLGGEVSGRQGGVVSTVAKEAAAAAATVRNDSRRRTQAGRAVVSRNPAVRSWLFSLLRPNATTNQLRRHGPGRRRPRRACGRGTGLLPTAARTGPDGVPSCVFRPLSVLPVDPR